MTFEGSTLTLNYAAKDGGSVTVELQDETGKAIPGFTSTEAEALTGDSVKATVQWKNGHTLSNLKGKPVRVRFVLKNADLFSMRFH